MEANVRALEGHRGFVLEKLGLYQFGESGRPRRRASERPEKQDAMTSGIGYC